MRQRGGGIAPAQYCLMLGPAGENIVPEDVTIMDKPDFEKLHLINQLDEDDKTTVFKIVDTMLTKKKFKDFFAKNVAAL